MKFIDIYNDLSDTSTKREFNKEFRLGIVVTYIDFYNVENGGSIDDCRLGKKLQLDEIFSLKHEEKEVMEELKYLKKVFDGQVTAYYVGKVEMGSLLALGFMNYYKERRWN